MVEENIHRICQATTEVVLRSTCGTYSIAQATSIKLGVQTRYHTLNMPIEEADVRITPHTKHAAVKGLERVVLLSGDTDVMVLALHFWEIFKADSLQELWMKAGVSNTIRYIPLHIIAEVNPELCKVLPAAHALTGSDCTSKVGTKLGAVKASPELYLTQFGVSLNSADIESVISNAEQYLIKVLKPKARCVTMDELRYFLYFQNKAIDVHELPPTSTAMRQHILRSMYATHMQINCLQNPGIDQAQYGFDTSNDFIIPITINNKVPDDIVLTCKCKVCSTIRCPCRRAGISCCMYCNCKQPFVDNACKNPLVDISVSIG